MLIFSKNNQQYIYIHITKNSGRYIRKQIKNKFQCYHLPRSDICDFAGSTLEGINTRYFMHFTYDKILPYLPSFTEVNPHFKFITFVRNPYHRLISAFYFSLLNFSLLNYNRPKKYCTIHSLMSITMEEYVNSLIENFKTFIKTELVEYLDNNHRDTIFYKQQFKYLTDENKNIPENMIIHKLEDYKSGSEVEQFFNFEDFDLKIYDLNKFYDNETLAIVNNVYAKDFELFGYEKVESI